MKNICILVILAFIGLRVNAQVVYIPDTIFKSYLLADTTINTNKDSSIQVSEAAAYSGVIDVSGLGIKDLTGIEAFAALTVLSCTNDSLTALDVTSNLALIWLDCSNNSLASLLLSPNTSLSYLYCNDNLLSDLDASYNQALTQLDCSDNNLTALNLAADSLLTSLTCYLNQLTTLDLSSNTALLYLTCQDNSLTSLNISSDTSLINLVCAINSLAVLDVSHNTQLTTLNCNVNSLTTLDVSANSAVTDLECGNNLLTSLDVSHNTLVTTLAVGGNLLTALDVSSNQYISYFDCDNNKITSLDMSADSALAHFDCISNLLTSLNLKNGNNENISTSEFYATSNPSLNCIAVDSVGYATANWTNIDAGVIFSTDCLTTSVNETGKPFIRVYPNPVTSILTVEIAGTAHISFKLYTILGDLSGSQQAAGNRITIDMTCKPAGLYMLKIMSAGGAVYPQLIAKQ